MLKDWTLTSTVAADALAGPTPDTVSVPASTPMNARLDHERTRRPTDQPSGKR
jgi:hypothetical protein